MIGYLKGCIADISDMKLTLEVGGIGYELEMPLSALMRFKHGENATVFTRMLVREDEIRLIGFCTKEERAMFDRLVSVSGLGPKLALCILSAMTVERLSVAIVTGDLAALKAIKGVGKKTAERVILELKDKLSADVSEDALLSPLEPAATDGDAVLALMTLGYTRAEAAAAVGRVDASGLTLEQTIVAALKG